MATTLTTSFPAMILLAAEPLLPTLSSKESEGVILICTRMGRRVGLHSIQSKLWASRSLPETRALTLHALTLAWAPAALMGFSDVRLLFRKCRVEDSA